ncbi:LysR substrate-binding domain-containing protein [Pseudonocardia sp.]|jgi:DNA-binding transcriptional LysR family regulator|uniref:LysR substrate-binding domain-containing protein n=1 Tax=Pseudonocardia sp. TaxID=60912 RepID=UPI0031FD9276
MELRQIRSFVVLADELHFSRAALRLHIVQPALSKQIKALESELGFSLLSRHQRGVELTAAGRVFRDQVEVMLRRLDRAVDLARATATGRAGALDVGFVRAAMWSVLPSALRDFRLATENIEVRLHELSSATQLQHVRDGLIDAGLVRLPVHDDSLDFEVIYSEPLLVALASNHPLAGEPRIDLAKLANETFLLLPRRGEPGFYDRCVAQCYEFGFGPTTVEESRGFAAILGMVGIGMGVTLLPSSTGSVGWPNVAVRPLSRASIMLDLALVRRHEPVSPALDRFASALHRAADRLVVRAN